MSGDEEKSSGEDFKFGNEQEGVEIRTSVVLPITLYRRLSIKRAILGRTYKDIINALIELYLNDDEVELKVFTLLKQEKERR